MSGKVIYEICTMTALGIIENAKVPVEVGLQTEIGYPHKGVLDYASPDVNQSTGPQVFVSATKGLCYSAMRGERRERPPGRARNSRRCR